MSIISCLGRMIFLTCRIFLIFILCVCLLVTGVFASDDNPNLLQRVQYDLFDFTTSFNGGSHFNPIFVKQPDDGIATLSFTPIFSSVYVSDVILEINHNEDNITACTGKFGSKVVDGEVLNAATSGNTILFLFDVDNAFSGSPVEFTLEFGSSGSSGVAIKAVNCLAYASAQTSVPWMQASWGVDSFNSFRTVSVGQSIVATHDVIAPDNPLNNSLKFKLRVGVDSNVGDYVIASFYVPFLSEWAGYDNWALPYCIQDISCFVISSGSQVLPLEYSIDFSYMPDRSIAVPGGYRWSSCYYVQVFVDLSGINLQTYTNPSIEIDLTCPGFGHSYSGGNLTVYGYALEVGLAVYGRYRSDGNQFASFGAWLDDKLDYLFGALGGQIDPTAPPEVQDAQDNAQAAIDQASEWEQSQYDAINSGSADAGQAVSSGITGFAHALAFVQTYTTNIANGIDDYLIVFTLPIFVGIFLYACSRVPGITRAFRDRRPKD